MLHPASSRTLRQRDAVPIGIGMNPTRRSRLHRQAHGRRILLSERDLALFRLLDAYRYLPADFLHAFLGGHKTHHRARLTDLFHEGWLDKPAAQWEAFNARYRPDTYALGQKAEAVLAEAGGASSVRIGAGGAFRHELMVCLIMASLELSSRASGIDLLPWRDILAMAPAATQALPSPFALPVMGGGASVLRPDGLPFGLRGRRSFFFVGIEADRHTEPLHPVDLRARSSSILRKFLQYQALVKERIFERHFGIPNLLVPFVTVSEEHMRNMMDLAMQVSEGRGFKWMLFRTIPAFGSPLMRATPDVTLLSKPWERAGNPPLSLLTELNRA